MKILALDVSTKSGWAVFEDETPKEWGTLFPDKTTKDFGPYPANFVKHAVYLADRLHREVIAKFWTPEVVVVIEETSASRQSYSQKILEYLHFCINQKLAELGAQVVYIRSGEWRKRVQARLSNEEKALNAKIARIKKATGQKLAKIDGKVVGKRGRKNVSIRVAKEQLGIELMRSQEDAAEALLLGLGYLRGAIPCDGTVTGGK